MTYNGAGVFVRLYNWVADRDAAIKINATRMDAEMDGIATGLSTALTKDGQTVATANQPMGGFRHTSVGNATARNQYASAAQIQDGSLVYASTVTGDENDIVLTFTPDITVLVEGMRLQFMAIDNNTDEVSLDVNSLGAIDVFKQGGADLTGGEILGGEITEVVYNGIYFQLVNLITANDRDRVLATQIFS